MMAVILADSCGDYLEPGTSQQLIIQGKYDDYTGGTGNFVVATGGRNGGHCYRVRHARTLVKHIEPSHVVGIGIAFNFPNYSSYERIIRVTGSGLTLDVMLSPDFKVVLRRNNAEISQSSATFPANMWHYLKIRFSVDPQDGFIKVYTGNASNIMAYRGDTGNTPLTRVMLGTAITQNQWSHYDDFMIEVFSHPNEDGFLGDCRVVARMPNADIQTQFERSSGSTNYENINEAGEGAPNDDTYVRGEPGDQDLYGLQTIQEAAGYTPRTVYAVQATARVIAEGEVQPFRTIIKSGDVESKSPQSFADASGEPRYIGTHCLDKDPETGLSWTLGKANQIQAGFKLEGGE